MSSGEGAAVGPSFLKLWALVMAQLWVLIPKTMGSGEGSDVGPSFLKLWALVRVQLWVPHS
jgi:hypothetical protein